VLEKSDLRDDDDDDWNQNEGSGFAVNVGRSPLCLKEWNGLGVIKE
jgi:hypothetical protein